MAEMLKQSTVSNDITQESDLLSLSSESVKEYQILNEKLFLAGEQYLNAMGVRTRTEYNNLLPTYHLMIEISKTLNLKTDNIVIEDL